MADEALFVEANGGASLHVPFGNIAAIGEPEAYTVTLADGTAIELTRLETMRTQLLAELREGRAGDAAEAAGAVGNADIFTGTIRDFPVEVHVYEDALLVVAGGGTQRIGFSFVTGIPGGMTGTADGAGRSAAGSGTSGRTGRWRPG